MDTTVTSSVMRSSHATADALQNVLGDVFAFRAEWLGERLFSSYREPGYIREVLDLKPCLLVGGRGTGKTTVLKSIAYEGKWRIERGSIPPTEWPYVGLYWRIDTNQVGAFVGDELDETSWTKVFGHYVNLALCTQLVKYLSWMGERVSARVELPAAEILAVSESLHIDAATTISDLLLALRKGMARFESNINNIGTTGAGLISLQGAPIRLLVEAMHNANIGAEQRVFFLIDEYENLLDYQQRVVNTLIKHGGELYTFKVAMKSNGHRDRRTLNPRESLQEPADYVTIDIAERLMGSEYDSFASAICDGRIASLFPEESDALAVGDLFPSTSEADEALLLGVAERVAQLRARLQAVATNEEIEQFDSLTPLHQYLVEFWALGHPESELECLRELIAEPDKQIVRLRNYQYAMLFTIRQRKVGLNKLYTGWHTYLRMSQGNLRYLLQLVHEALRLHFERGLGLNEPISAEVQTRAAQNVGRTNLVDLKGLDSRGADLTRMVLSLGRVFHVLARQPYGHTPEVAQFQLAGTDGVVATDAVLLLESAVANLALIRFISNKMSGTSGEIKDYDYAIHPIFSAFFEITDRSKRRMQISDAEILGCVSASKETVSSILSRIYKSGSVEIESSGQLSLFGRYYDAL